MAIECWRRWLLLPFATCYLHKCWMYHRASAVFVSAPAPCQQIFKGKSRIKISFCGIVTESDEGRRKRDFWSGKTENKKDENPMEKSFIASFYHPVTDSTEVNNKILFFLWHFHPLPLIQSPSLFLSAECFECVKYILCISGNIFQLWLSILFPHKYIISCVVWERAHTSASIQSYARRKR